MIATLATRAAADGIDVIIVTGDRDSYQLVLDPHVKVLYNRRGVSDYVLYDEAGIFERTGVTPAQYPEYAALRGDPSDNLPGVPGIGEKTAAKLITTYGNLEGIYEHLDELPPKQRQNLGEARDRVFLNREMSLLRLDCDVDVDARRPARWARGTASRCGSCSTSSRSARCCPRLLEAVGESAAAESRGATRSTSTSSVARDADRGRCELLGDARRERRAATRSKRAGKARRARARCAASRSRPTTRRPPTSTASLLADPTVRAALLRAASTPAARRSSRTGPRS